MVGKKHEFKAESMIIKLDMIEVGGILKSSKVRLPEILKYHLLAVEPWVVLLKLSGLGFPTCKTGGLDKINNLKSPFCQDLCFSCLYCL